MKKIDGYDNYFISRNGEVLNSKTGKILKHCFAAGYQVVYLSKHNKRKTHSIHRLIGIYFIRNPENKPWINHKNGIRSDFRIRNLEWSTIHENLQHAYDTGLHVAHRKKINLGEAGGQCKINKKIVRKIRQSKETQQAIANRYGISQTQVFRIIHKQRWGHLK